MKRKIRQGFCNLMDGQKQNGDSRQKLTKPYQETIVERNENPRDRIRQL
jgi:hypothetical protein